MTPSRARLTAGLLALALSVFSPSNSRATSVVPVTIEELSTRSELVLIARVRQTQAHWESRMIVTDVALEPIQILRGTQRENVVVRVPGGSVGRIGQLVPGVVVPEVGATYAFFLQHATDGPSVFYLTHLTAAILSVRIEQGNPSVIMPATEGMVVRGTAPTNTVMERTGLAIPTFQRALEARR